MIIVVKILGALLLYAASGLAAWAEIPDNQPDYRYHYAYLQRALAYYQHLASLPWPRLHYCQPRSRCGAASMAAVQQRLVITGDLAALSNDTEVVSQAVRRFQWRHGLSVTGTLNQATMDTLNVPPGLRVLELEDSIESWHIKALIAGERVIIVNIPEYRLRAISAGQVVLSMRVIVGRPSTPTPILGSRITSAELNPYWYVPTSILKRYLLAKLSNYSPDDILHKGYELFANIDDQLVKVEQDEVDWASVGDNLEQEGNLLYMVRQKPGGYNSLGLLKFIFPNNANIYLHDSPEKDLFNKAQRALSSGCVRIEQPFALLAYLLTNNPDYTWAMIADKLLKQRPALINFQAVPIYIIYAPAWFDHLGVLHFTQDPYAYYQQDAA